MGRFIMHIPFRETWRALIRDARFAVTAVLLLSVTIGSVLAVYAMVDALVLRPFLFADQVSPVHHLAA